MVLPINMFWEKKLENKIYLSAEKKSVMFNLSSITQFSSSDWRTMKNFPLLYRCLFMILIQQNSLLFQSFGNFNNIFFPLWSKLVDYSGLQIWISSNQCYLVWISCKLCSTLPTTHDNVHHISDTIFIRDTLYIPTCDTCNTALLVHSAVVMFCGLYGEI